MKTYEDFRKTIISIFDFIKHDKSSKIFSEEVDYIENINEMIDRYYAVYNCMDGKGCGTGSFESRLKAYIDKYLSSNFMLIESSDVADLLSENIIDYLCSYCYGISDDEFIYDEDTDETVFFTRNDERLNIDEYESFFSDECTVVYDFFHQIFSLCEELIKNIKNSDSILERHNQYSKILDQIDEINITYEDNYYTNGAATLVHSILYQLSNENLKDIELGIQYDECGEETYFIYLKRTNESKIRIDFFKDNTEL